VVDDLAVHGLGAFPAPGPIAVDLAGTRKGSQIANRYWTHGGIETTSWGAISVSTGDMSGGSRATFAYKPLGTLRSGTHVLETRSQPGGVGVFTDLLFVRFVVGDDYEGARPNTVERRTTLLMKRVGSYGLGNRYAGTIVIREDAVEVDAENDGGGAKIVLRVP
jgi:hypothetical protein